MPKVNPFRPNSPVHPGMFAGRGSELQRLEAALLQTKAGNPANFMITGERGIGKSSLLNYVKSVAQGDIALEDSTLSFLVVDTDINENTVQLDLVKKIELALGRALGKTEAARQFLKQSWDFLKRVEAAGVKVRTTEHLGGDEIVIEEFSYSLADITSRVCSDGPVDIFSSRYDGILILIDEADNASQQLSLGSFIKLLTERLLRRGCTKVAFGVAGLPELRNVLTLSHASSLRLFEELILDRLTEKEVERVISSGLRRANKTSDAEIKITDEAIKQLVYFSEGYPHFIQQFSSSAFDQDTDNNIDKDDVVAGGLGRRGAMELIGDRYYRDNFYNKIQKESYRQVLRIMADKLDAGSQKKISRQNFTGTIQFWTTRCML